MVLERGQHEDQEAEQKHQRQKPTQLFDKYDHRRHLPQTGVKDRGQVIHITPFRRWRNIPGQFTDSHCFSKRDTGLLFYLPDAPSGNRQRFDMTGHLSYSRQKCY
jgi:hypothetical protein